jgi:creatinine amidohydrolase/Fe(II)-dependent formamide hydrolase-like protein
LIISEIILEKFVRKIQNRYPDYNIIKLPSLPLGSSLLPVKGSFEIKASILEKLLDNYAINLNKMGFKYLFIMDNHGGPAHQMAIEAASHKAFKRNGFYLFDPFNYLFKKMVEDDKQLLEDIEASPGECGDDQDLHAGNNETSLMLYLSPDDVKEYKNLKNSLVPEYKGLSKVVKSIAELFNSQSLSHLAVNLSWIKEDNIIPYIGSPAKAEITKGKKMVEARVKIALGLFERALRGEEIKERPLLWKLRFLRYFFKLMNY